MHSSDLKSILLFDGICNLCNSSVQFILKRDTNEQFIFASLQSDAAKNVLLQYNMKNSSLDSLVLIEEGQVFQKSTAVLKVCRHLKWPWKVFYSFIVIPKFLRDGIYEFVAKHRYQWFGKKDTCVMVIPEHKNRFI